MLDLVLLNVFFVVVPLLVYLLYIVYDNVMEEKGKVITASLDLPKSMVVTTEYVYITPVSPQTLEKRFKMWQAGRKD